MPVRSGNSAVELGEKTSMWYKHSAETVTGTFLASKTKRQRLLSWSPGGLRQFFFFFFALKSSTRLVVCSRISRLRGVPSMQTICLYCRRWRKVFPSLFWSEKLVMAIVTVLAIETVMAIVTVLASSRSFRTRTGYRIQGMHSKVAKSSSHQSGGCRDCPSLARDTLLRSDPSYHS